MSVKEYTLAEVATHNTRDDLFMIIRDEVYSISKFVTEVSLINFVNLNLETDPILLKFPVLASR